MDARQNFYAYAGNTIQTYSETTSTYFPVTLMLLENLSTFQFCTARITSYKSFELTLKIQTMHQTALTA